MTTTTHTTTPTTTRTSTTAAGARFAEPVTSVAAAHRDELASSLIERVEALPRATRVELHELAAGTAWLLKMGRSIRLLPILFVILWPLLLPWLLGRLLRLRRLGRDPLVRALLDDSVPVRRARIQDRTIDDPALYDLVNAREGVAVTSYCVVGPPLILCGFAVAIAVAGR